MTDVLVVPHTHWDREWYLPFQAFRSQLVDLIDGLLELLEGDPDFGPFTLDGQAVILEDYLAIRPEAESRLRALVQARRLMIGPWYVLPDEFLVSGEALIRNLLIGRSVTWQFGEPMAVGYCPDAFGHVSQLPQILQGFGIDNAILSRGLGDEGEHLGSEFIWEAPDGSAVLAIHQIGGALDRNSGYYNAAVLGYPRLWGERVGPPDLECAREHAEALVAILRRYARTPYLLFNNGGDHLAPQRELPTILASLNARLPGLTFRQGAYREYVELVKSAARTLVRWRGELRGARYNHILTGVYSTRLYLKQANARVQSLLERWAEPFSALARLHGGADAVDHQPSLRLAWKLLLHNHAHDSICGCSVDEVHFEMGSRFDQAEALGTSIASASLGQIVGQVATRDLPPGPLVAVFNPLGATRTELVVGFVRLPPDLLQGPLVAVDVDGRASPCQILASESAPAGEARPQVGLVAPGVPGIGYRTLAIRRGTADSAVRADTTGPAPAIENDRYRVETAADGRLRIVHRPTGYTLDGGYLLVDEADAGDEYNYAPAPEAHVVTSAGCSARLSLLQAGPAIATLVVEHELWLPAGLTADRRRRSDEHIPLRVRTLVSLAAGGRWVDLRTSIENGSRDHRLRAVFPTGRQTTDMEVLGHFDRLRRPVVPPPAPHWAEPPGPTNHQNGYVAAMAGGLGVALLSPELPEYLAEPGDRGVDLSLTLLRCVGWLSRSDLSTRPEPAGPELATPGAQCPGLFCPRYAVAVFADEEARELPTWAEAYRTPMRLYPAVRQPGTLPPELAFVEVEGPAVLTALKTAEDGNGLIARLYNPGDHAAEVALHVAWPLAGARLTRLDETPTTPLPTLHARHLAFSMDPRQIVTVRLVSRQ